MRCKIIFLRVLCFDSSKRFCLFGTKGQTRIFTVLQKNAPKTYNLIAVTQDIVLNKLFSHGMSQYVLFRTGF